MESDSSSSFQRVLDNVTSAPISSPCISHVLSPTLIISANPHPPLFPSLFALVSFHVFLLSTPVWSSTRLPTCFLLYTSLLASFLFSYCFQPLVASPHLNIGTSSPLLFPSLYLSLLTLLTCSRGAKMNAQGYFSCPQAALLLLISVLEEVKIAKQWLCLFRRK